MASPRTEGFLIYVASLAVVILILAFLRASAAQSGDDVSLVHLLLGMLVMTYVLFYAVDHVVRRRIEELDAGDER